MKIVCLDIGGTTIKYALIESNSNKFDFNILKFDRVYTNAKKGFEAIRSNIFKAIESVDYKNADAIAVSSAGNIDWNTGVCTYATNTLPNFTGYKIKDDIKKRYNKRVVVINDAQAAAIAEHFCVDNVNEKDIILTLGTGLGSALVKGTNLNESSVEDLHLGHIEYVHNGLQCTCGKKGCVEQYLSATALKRDSKEDNLDLVFSNYDKYAKTIDNFLDALCKIVKYSIDKFSPNRIIIGGGVIEMKNLWWDLFLAKLGDKANVVSPAKLGNKAGVLGAAYSLMYGEFINQ